MTLNKCFIPLHITKGGECDLGTCQRGEHRHSTCTADSINEVFLTETEGIEITVNFNPLSSFLWVVFWLFGDFCWGGGVLFMVAFLYG